MIKLSRIKKRILSSQGQKTSLTILIVGIFFFAPTFAQEATTQTSKLLTNAQYLISEFIKLLSRSWIILASLAGKFMTNDMVYGSWLHLDAYLWKLRNICKNFANFALLGILLREIIQYISKKTGSVQSIVTKSVIAGILIQASWFLMAVLLDISTIATAAIASFPTHFIDSNALSKETIRNEIALNMKSYTIKLDKEGTPSTIKNDNTTDFDVEAFIDKIMPKSDSVAGPLIYIGASTLRIQNALNRPAEQDPNPKKIITTSVMQFLAIGVYCVTLILLLITNIIRIGLLWVIIPLSPILVLMFTLGKDMKGINKNFNMGVILNAIFKPVIFTGVLSLVLIFIVSMQNIMISGNDQSFSIQGTTFSASGSLASMEVNEIFKTTINDTVFTQAGNTGKNIFSNIIIYFATIFLLRSLVKIAAKSGGGTIGDTMTNLTGQFEDMAKLAPVFPVGGGIGWNSLKKSGESLKQGVAQGFNMETDGSGRSKQNKDFEKDINRMLGVLPSWNKDDWKKIEKGINSSDHNLFFKETKEAIGTKSDKKSGHQGGLNIDNGTRRPLLERRLEEHKDRLREFGFKDNNYTKDKLDEFLKIEKNRKNIHELLGGNDNSNIKVNSYNDFKKAIYGNIEY